VRSPAPRSRSTPGSTTINAGWISADLRSLRRRSTSRAERDACQFVDGVDLIVSIPQRDRHYAPGDRRLGVGDLLASATGDEITTSNGALRRPAARDEASSGARSRRSRRADLRDVRGAPGA
jgi:hypothetical protein